MFHKLAAALVLLLTIALATTPAMAGTADDPEITDPAGDANVASAVAGDESDTRPASLDNADLRAVWFETIFQVIGGEERPTALSIHFETEGPIRSGPLSNRQFLYEVSATLPACQVVFRFTAAPDPANDQVALWAVDACPGLNAGSGVPSPVSPTVNGTSATITFPLNHQQLPGIIPAGTTVGGPVAQVRTTGVSVVTPTVDLTAAGRNFTIG